MSVTSEPVKKLVFLDINQFASSGRSLYRQALKLVEAYPDLECVNIGLSSFLGETKVDIKNCRVKDLSRFRHRNRIMKRIVLLRACLSERPDWIQASDVRALIPAVILKVLTGAKLVYDAREDYFRQPYEYRGKTFRALLRACKYRLTELLLVRFAMAVFCTDDYLYMLYNKRIFGARRVFMMRNFVNSSLVQSFARPPVPGEPLRMVYIGGINPYRGVIECAKYVARYNEECGHNFLTLDIYGPTNSLLDNLIRDGHLRHHQWVSHPDVFRVLKDYHVGICLLLRIKKFERNLPVKNFEYMAVGLPVLTSDFGNVAKYVRQVESGLCIDPKSYSAFETAINSLRKIDIWNKFSKKGIHATETCYHHAAEAKAYIDIFK